MWYYMGKGEYVMGSNRIKTVADMQKAENDFLKKVNFVEDFGLEFTDEKSFTRCFLISKDRRFYCTPIMSNPIFRVDKLDDVVDVSISENNAQVQGLHDMMVGNALLGAPGALAAGLGKGGKVNDLHLDIVLKSTRDAHMRIDLIDDPVRIKSDMYQVVILTAEKIYAQLKSAIALSPDSLSSADEIRKFKELADDGIITQEEFEAKKKQLLGL